MMMMVIMKRLLIPGCLPASLSSPFSQQWGLQHLIILITTMTTIMMMMMVMMMTTTVLQVQHKRGARQCVSGEQGL